MNQAACRLLGYSREELLARGPEDITVPGEMARVAAQRPTRTKPGEAVFEVELLTRDGRRVPVEFSTCVFELAGEMVQVASARDLTERQQANLAIRQLEERFQVAFRANPCLMYVASYPENRLLDVNLAWVRTTGYSREESLGYTPQELQVTLDGQKYLELWQELQDRGQILNQEINFRTKAGEVREGLLSREVIRVGDKLCVLSVIVDITQRRQMEREMARLDRLNLVGQMAAAIGHEVRNPLTTIRGFLQLMEESPELAGYREDFVLMIDELDRANSIITEFLSLARSKAVGMQSRSLNQLLRTLHPLLLADALHTGHELRLELGDVGELMLNGREIYQLVLNLVRNGMDAMPQGGELTICTYRQNGSTYLEVRDQGQGIPPEHRDKIGRPFFTTKEQGTGLGLATCYSIAARHNARIDFASGTTGTTFTVQFGDSQVP